MAGRAASTGTASRENRRRALRSASPRNSEVERVAGRGLWHGCAWRFSRCTAYLARAEGRARRTGRLLFQDCVDRRRGAVQGLLGPRIADQDLLDSLVVYAGDL